LQNHFVGIGFAKIKNFETLSNIQYRMLKRMLDGAGPISTGAFRPRFPQHGWIIKENQIQVNTALYQDRVNLAHIAIFHTINNYLLPGSCHI
jgi:hypothetical protein